MDIFKEIFEKITDLLSKVFGTSTKYTNYIVILILALISSQIINVKFKFGK